MSETKSPPRGEVLPEDPLVSHDQSVSASMHGIEEQIDFKPYLDAVNAGSNRTRATVYVLLALAVLVLTGYRYTTSPDWLDQRLAQFQLASACVKDQSWGESSCVTSSPRQSGKCLEAINYSKKFLYSNKEPDPILMKQEFCAELSEQINILIRQRTEALSMRLPFFGVVIDMNDLGLIIGVFMAFVLYVFCIELDREVDNLDRAIDRAMQAQSESKQKENLELLLMTQVLASKKGATYGVHILLIGIVSAHLLVLIDDLCTAPTAILLEGPLTGWLETAFDVFVFLIVVGLCSWAWIKQRELDRKVDNLIARLEMVETVLNDQPARATRIVSA